MGRPDIARDMDPEFSPSRTYTVELPSSEASALPVAPERRSLEPWSLADASIDLGTRRYLRLLLRYKRLILAVMAGTMLLTTAKILLRPRLYMATATILPSSGQGSSGLLGLIANVTGAPPVGMSEETSSFLFPSILESRAVGLEVLRAEYSFKTDGRLVQRTLEEHLKAENPDKALKILHRIVSIDVHKETGMITLAASTPHPELSAQIANRFVESLERLNLEMRQSTAALNSAFIQERLDQSFRELEEAEQRLTTFREQNVRMSSPDLELERLRLERDVTLKSQLYVTLSSQAEIARIEEAKDLPVVRVLDRAAVPNLPVPVPKLSSLLLGAIAAFLMAVAAVAGAETWHYLRRELAFTRQAACGTAD